MKEGNDTTVAEATDVSLFLLRFEETEAADSGKFIEAK